MATADDPADTDQKMAKMVAMKVAAAPRQSNRSCMMCKLSTAIKVQREGKVDAQEATCWYAN